MEPEIIDLRREVICEQPVVAPIAGPGAVKCQWADAADTKWFEFRLVARSGTEGREIDLLLQFFLNLVRRPILDDQSIAFDGRVPLFIDGEEATVSDQVVHPLVECCDGNQRQII